MTETRKKGLLFRQWLCWLLTLAAISSTETLLAQRYAVIDMNYMLSKMPEYARVDTTLELLTAKWQKEVDSAGHYADSLRNDYKAEQYMLADELKAKRMLQIQNAETEVRNLRTGYFGYQGQLFKKRAELVQPIQNKIYSIIQQLSVKYGWDFVLDKSAGTQVIFSDPKLNKSDVILEAMGIKTK
ncbi:periplasmic chaperone for outer membrane proteins Skp [Arachidicoccus rhizosphaerae]|uniref:Periplasmic chaperone for outer membrane proteins Skp n=1 Tax=Arachidicoccus rhizosphaerae TaxID=551991 RepID=A0A1H4C9V1_9BACT|nr:OmpH family outer membrane protein [Arachidicoccus rhizosphaerae]SEA57205.1 periplasmic chaperone for outer membrane proteins Skp [Arachidicoccus rhizosphaerae]